MVASSSRQRSTTGAEPATITASVPLTAPATPPLTGESIISMPLAASPAATSAVTRGPVVDRSTKILTLLPLATPWAPSATSRTMSGLGRLTNTTSALSPTAAQLSASSAPFAARRSAAARRVSNTLSRLLLASRRVAIGKPIFPRPMNPTPSNMPHSSRRPSRRLLVVKFGPAFLYKRGYTLDHVAGHGAGREIQRLELQMGLQIVRQGAR